MQTLLLPLIIGRTQIALWDKGCYVRGRSSGKTGPPGTTGFTAVRGGAIKSENGRPRPAPMRS